MSFVITAYVREGIVMASDSRLTLNATQTPQGQGAPVIQLSVGQSDSTNKTSLALGKFGISTYGAADVNGVPISGYLESFISERLAQGTFEVDQVPAELVAYFTALPTTPASVFHVAGYKVVNGVQEQHVWQVPLTGGVPSKLNPAGQQGVSWGGEIDVLSRLLQPLAAQDLQGNWQPLPTHQIPYGFFTLQGAIDFCIYAVRTTIDTLRFQPRPKTVGGPIDVLVIKPDGAFWVQKKKLHGTG